MKKFLFKSFVFLLIIIIIALSIMFGLGYFYYTEAVHKKSLTKRVDEVITKEHFLEYDKLPENYVKAVIAVEDHRYYNHGPVDFIGIARAMYTNIRNKDLDEGGSTITQQVAKNVVFNQDKNFIRKFGEVFAAYELEKNYTKQEILALYANSCYFGDGYYCIYDASKGYFNKEPKNLNLEECAMLAGIPNAPSVYSPTANPDLAKKRQAYVLEKMNGD